MDAKDVQKRVDFLLSITHANNDGSMAEDFVGFNSPDYLFFRNAEINVDIVPDSLFKLKKYKVQLESQGLWDESIENAERPEIAGLKTRKPIGVSGYTLVQKGPLVEISKMDGHIWDLINALKARGGRAQKSTDGYYWIIESKKLFQNRAQFEKLGIDFSKIKEIESNQSVNLTQGQSLSISRKRTKITFHFAYNVELINFLRAHRGFKYNKEDHSRSISLNSETAEGVKGFIERARSLKLSILGEEHLHDLEEKVKDAIRERREAGELRQELDVVKHDFDVIVPGLERLKLAPFGYQRAGIAFLNKTNGRGIIGDEMGLGKTLQALAWVVTNNKRAVVICPKSFIFGWKDEIEKFSNATVQVLTNKNKKNKKNAADFDLVGADFTIVNYESAEKYDFTDFDTLIIDESHLVKNRKTARFIEIEKLSKKAEHVICLSGTAILNRPVEFFTQLSLVKPGITGSYSKFTKRYCGAFHDGYGWKVGGATNLDGLVNLISPVYIRRNKKDVLKDLPDKIRQEIVVEGVEIADPEDSSQSGMLSWITRAKVHLAKSKTEATIEFAKNMVEQGDKVVIFSDYVDPVLKIAEAFGEEAICYLAEMSPEERTAAQKQFQEDPNKKVFVATSKLASVALTLTAASKVIFNDLPWNPGNLCQAEDRCHRIGQKDTVNVYRMVARGTLDDQVTALLTSKAEILKVVLEGKSFQLSESESTQAEKSILTDIINVFRVQRSGKKPNFLNP